jgi:hypothetical protein
MGAETWPQAAFGDDVLATYVESHESASLVTKWYARWRAPPRWERSGCSAAYTAELDQEVTARTCAKAILELERWLPQR